MRGSQIVRVNVIANAGTVRRRVVISEQVDLLPLAQRHLKHQRYQVQFGIVVFAELAVGVGARRIEVAQKREPRP